MSGSSRPVQAAAGSTSSQFKVEPAPHHARVAESALPTVPALVHQALRVKLAVRPKFPPRLSPQSQMLTAKSRRRLLERLLWSFLLTVSRQLHNLRRGNKWYRYMSR